MRARAPGSAANLGPGFDSLAVALPLYCEVTVEPALRLEVTSEGEGSEVARDGAHLAAAVVTGVLGRDDVAIHVRSEIPVGRGLGSSAALAVAAAAAAGSGDAFQVAASSDGHPENAAASLAGGLVAAAVVDGEALWRPLPLDPDIRFVLVIPELSLPTPAMRAALPASVAFGDAVANLSRLGLLVSAAGEDRIHQQPRESLFPQSTPLLAALRAGGAVVASWSGAGPSMLGVCVNDESARSAGRAGEKALGELGLSGRVVVLEADRRGLVVG